MIKSLVCMPLDMRVDVLDEIDLGPGRGKEYLVNWTEYAGLTWISEKSLAALEDLVHAWEGQPVS